MSNDGFERVAESDLPDPWLLAPGSAPDYAGRPGQYGWCMVANSNEAHGFRRGYGATQAVCGHALKGNQHYPRPQDKPCLVCKSKIESTVQWQKDDDQQQALRVIKEMIEKGGAGEEYWKL